MNKIRNFWQKLPITGKTKIFLLITMAGVLVSAISNAWIVGSSLRSLNRMVSDASACSGALEAVRNETTLFDRYIREKGTSNEETFNASCLETQEMVESLPSDYSLIGPERSARLWRVINTYRSYVNARNQIINLYEKGDEDVPLLYDVYGMQSWISEYLQDLVQVTVGEYAILYDQKEEALARIPYLMGLLVLLAFLLTTAATGLLNRSLVRPVRKMSDAVNRISKGDFGGEDIRVDNQDELGELASALNIMKHSFQLHLETLEENQRLSEELHKEAVQRMEAEQQLDTARLRLLRSQMDPHFLFNTLNVISGMAELEEAETTDRMIRSLSSIFRYNLQTEADLVPLSRELKAVQDYMYLQHMRFGDRIRYQEILSPDLPADSVYLPPLLIQPLVENAIIHGLYDREGDGLITLSASLAEGNLLQIEVTDNGTGMSPEALEKLRDAVRHPEMHKASSPGGERRVGIGLGNLAARLQKLGEGARILIESRENEGTRILLMIPQKTKDVGLT